MMNLSEAIIHGTVNAVEQKLKQVIEVNYLDEYGYTPLIETAIVNDCEKARLLLKAGSDPNQKDITGRTPLHWAVDNNNLDLAQLLLTHGANANAFNLAGEPVLVKPLLKHQKDLKTLLIQNNARTRFAYDYIYAKLIGHRFELIGSVDIVDPDGMFIEVDYEGFYLELSLDLIAYSLQAFRQNFAARPLAPWFYSIDMIHQVLTTQTQLMRYDHYLADINQYRKEIIPILSQDTLALPINQTGHAAMLIKHKNLFAICDRSHDGLAHDHIPIYYINKPHGMSTDLLLDLLYRKHTLSDIYEQLHNRLKLQVIAEIPITAQTIGNCSWANVEAAIPLLYWMQQANYPKNQLNKTEITKDSIELFQSWKTWDQQRALQLAIRAFHGANPQRKASIAALLAAVLFQRYCATHTDELPQAESIIAILKTKGYEYILESYIQHYVHNKSTRAGSNLMHWLKKYELWTA